MERKHSGAANTRTVQQAQRQTLHERQRRGLGGTVVYGPGDGRLGQDGIYAHYMAMLQLQHSGKKGLCSLERRKNIKGRAKVGNRDEVEESVKIEGGIYSAEQKRDQRRKTNSISISI